MKNLSAKKINKLINLVYKLCLQKPKNFRLYNNSESVLHNVFTVNENKSVTIIHTTFQNGLIVTKNFHQNFCSYYTLKI